MPRCVPRKGAFVSRVLVTGGAGFIGRHSVCALHQAGNDVRVLDSLRPPVHRDGTAPDFPPGVEFHRGDVQDRAALREALEGVDAVLHLAAYQDYLPDFSSFYAINTAATALLYEIIVGDHLPIRRVVVAATQAEYGEGAYRCPDCGLVHPEPRSPEDLARGAWEARCPDCRGPVTMCPTDERVVKPHSPYAMSKRAAEEAALTLGRRYDIPTATLRYSIVQGPGQSFHNVYSGALRAFAVQALHGLAPLVYEDGRQIRDYVWIGDVVAANLLMLDRRDLVGCFNVGGDRRVTVHELARLVLDETGLDAAPRIPGTFRVGDTRHIQSDVSALRALGWAPTLDQRSIVRAYIAWARQQPELADTATDAIRRMRNLGVLRDAQPHAAGSRSDS